MRLLVTGGCGFVGSNFIRYVLDHYQPEMITNVDALLSPNAERRRVAFGSQYGERYEFFRADIADRGSMNEILSRHSYFAIANFAAESRDESRTAPDKFFQTNVTGVSRLLDAAREHGVKRFVQVSTADVYGPGPAGSGEQRVLNPASSFAATKGAADLLALSARNSRNQDVVVVRSSKNFGTCQDPDKLVPVAIINGLLNRPFGLSADGLEVRDWIHVEDHCAAVFDILMQGRAGEIYNVGSGDELPTVELVGWILSHLGRAKDLVRFNPAGRSARYALDASKVRNEIGWKPLYSFESRLAQTVAWYRANAGWWEGRQGI